MDLPWQQRVTPIFFLPWAFVPPRRRGALKSGTGLAACICLPFVTSTARRSEVYRYDRDSHETDDARREHGLSGPSPAADKRTALTEQPVTAACCLPRRGEGPKENGAERSEAANHGRRNARRTTDEQSPAGGRSTWIASPRRSCAVLFLVRCVPSCSA
ncbi:uncharacterized protein LOC143354064 [Halictus rubicundus]|uniref:uncharacterized protein LOC143354064 n=1 Tax=Halictus rubicundus TaxID=77578 RepID=UPI0040362423